MPEEATIVSLGVAEAVVEAVVRNHLDQNHLDRNHLDRNHLDRNHLDVHHQDVHHLDLQGRVAGVVVRSCVRVGDRSEALQVEAL